MSAVASKRWREKHPEQVREQKRLYYRRSYLRLREQRNSKNKARGIAIREAAHELLGGVCCRCGFADWRALQIDHLNGNGRHDRSRFMNREQFLKAVLEEPEKYQLLCSNCNWIKRHEQHEFGLGRPTMVDMAVTED